VRFIFLVFLCLATGAVPGFAADVMPIRVSPSSIATLVQAPTQGALPSSSVAAPTASDSFMAPATLLGPAPPYVPRETDFTFEVGLVETGGEELVGGGFDYGVHIGRCVFSKSQTCQQYIDGLFGFAAREAETEGYFLGSLRWQYVNFPDRYSPFWRVFGGETVIARETRGWHPTGGVGFGVVNYLHERVDLRVELRVGRHERWFAQGILGFQIKIDRLLEYFAVKLKDLGVGAVGTVIEATGTAVKATGEGLGGIVHGVAAPFQSDSSKETKDSPQQPRKDSSPADP
jgi:hypothetical protein